ncbi:hypothetical protein GJV26_00140 [Massilia dura]|uniref:Phage tail fibre protein N-terminal domain-containing protein n=1 Tax=Pseudoduganella dura TaxID=321982 RepID=A0A6I3X535_9BURK|nr:phage tail protein [Pseudoduganella dura]MUI10906.1 hypothetical protein [Pseudoduganella dura]GGY12859.1 hypothetical protein GCM10007386_49060 [Pseudoduganella dura]
MTTFFSVPTLVGLAELAGAIRDGMTVPFTHLAIGDGGGNPVDPTGRTGLVREVDRVQVASIKKHPAEPTWLVVEAAIPEDRGGYWIRELALIGGRAGGKVMSVSNYPAVERPAPGAGAVTGMVLRMVVAFVDAAAVSVLVDPQAYATLQAVLDQIGIHEGKADPHPQYTTPGEAATVAATAVGMHQAEADPHPQYARVGRLLTADVLKALRGARAFRFFNSAS